jgi:hypothetical protein
MSAEIWRTKTNRFAIQTETDRAVEIGPVGQDMGGKRTNPPPAPGKPRALEVGPGQAVDECVFANHHGAPERGFARGPQVIYLPDDAPMDASAPKA